MEELLTEFRKLELKLQAIVVSFGLLRDKFEKESDHTVTTKVTTSDHK